MPSRSLVKWWAKLAAKSAAGVLPVSPQMWKRIGVFDHGPMESPEYACSVFEKHFQHFERIRTARGLANREFQCLELGPGSSLASCVIAKACGAKKCVMVDIADLALVDASVYRGLGRYLNQHELPAPNLEDVDNVQAVLKLCGGLYMTAGLESLEKLPAKSFDFIWSHTVLQHIDRKELLETLKELRRVIRPDGIASHEVDFRDMLTGSANHLTMPDWLWNLGVLKSGNVYTNRVLRSDLIRVCERVGFEVEVVEQSMWAKEPVPRANLQPRFRKAPEQDLLTESMQILLRPKN